MHKIGGITTMFFLLFTTGFSLAINESTQYWISDKIEAISWKPNCLSTLICSQPRFEMALSLPQFDKKVCMTLSCLLLF